MSWTQISPRIFRWTDTCNVYCVTSGDRGILIDTGSGAVVDRLEEIGVRQIEWVLHTHHHRDQSWGTGRLREHGAKVAVPEHERHLFDQAELFWQHKRVYDNYNDRNTFFTLARRTCRSTPTSRTTKPSPGATSSWKSSPPRATPTAAACSSAASTVEASPLLAIC